MINEWEFSLRTFKGKKWLPVKWFNNSWVVIKVKWCDSGFNKIGPLKKLKAYRLIPNWKITTNLRIVSQISDNNAVQFGGSIVILFKNCDFFEDLLALSSNESIWNQFIIWSEHGECWSQAVPEVVTNVQLCFIQLSPTKWWQNRALYLTLGARSNEWDEWRICARQLSVMWSERLCWIL